MTYTVLMTWDDEAAVWVATSDDIKGLVLESGSLDALIEKVKYAVPELLELNGEIMPERVPVTFRSVRNESVLVG